MGFAIKRLTSANVNEVGNLYVNVYKDVFNFGDSVSEEQKKQMVFNNIKPVLSPIVSQGNCIGCFSDGKLIGGILAFDFYQMNTEDSDVIKNLFTGFAFKPVEVSRLGRQVMFIHSAFVADQFRQHKVLKNMLKCLVSINPNKVLVTYTSDRLIGRIVEHLGFNSVTERNGVKLLQFNTDPVKRAGAHSKQMDEVEANGGHVRGTDDIMTSDGGSSDDEDEPFTEKSGSTLKKILPLVIIGVLIVAIIGVVAYRKSHNNKPIVQIGNPYKSAQQSLENALHSYDASMLDKVVGVKEGDSYLAQEWAWVNNNALRQEYIKKMCGLVKFDYSSDSETVKVTIPDFDSMASIVSDDDNKRLISMYMESAGYKDTDYDWTYELADLMCQWVTELKEIPTTTKNIKIPVQNGVVTDDSALDDAIFGSDEFHNFEDKFGQVAINWAGKKKEVYFEYEMRDNPEYAKWKERFEHYYFADGGYYDSDLGRYRGGHFSKEYSKWEPFFKYQKKGSKKVVQRYKNGDLKVRYYAVKDENGNDWIQPAKQTKQKVKKTRMVDDTWEPEHVLLYNVFGTHYIQTSYNGKGYKTFQVGDGTIKHPAGVGTWIITKALCADGKYHDVRVAVIGYWKGQDALDYLEQIDARNVGHTTESSIQYITYEVRVENLEDDTIVLPSTEMCLADRNSNTFGKSGTEYGFTTNVEIKAHEIVTMNDWDSSTELDQYYVCWGGDFERTYPFVFFKILAGTGKVPKYSAYEQFTGSSSMFNEDGTRTQDPYAESSGTQDNGNSTRSVVQTGTNNESSGTQSTVVDSIGGTPDTDNDVGNVGGTPATNNDSSSVGGTPATGSTGSSSTDSPSGGTSSSQTTGTSDSSGVMGSSNSPDSGSDSTTGTSPTSSSMGTASQ